MPNSSQTVYDLIGPDGFERVIETFSRAGITEPARGVMAGYFGRTATQMINTYRPD